MNKDFSAIMYRKEVVDAILTCYCNGMEENLISECLGIAGDDVNEILNRYTKYL